MSDIISAKCFACGHVVKVPSGLGGKKARCPKCTNTIAIPAMSETQDDIVGDDQLPEVAKDGELVEGEEVLEEDPEPAPRPDSRRERPGSSPSNRRLSPLRDGGSTGRSGTRMQAARGPAPAPRKSNTGVIVGVILAVSVVVAIAVGASMKGGGGSNAKNAKAPPGQVPDGPNPPPPPPAIGDSAADQALEARCREFLSTWNRAQIAQAAAFYDPEPGADIRKKVGQLIEGGVQYHRPDFKVVSAANSLTTFVCEYRSNAEAAQAKEISLKWKQVDGTWYIADRP
jgi:hypothetical protein